MSRKLLAFPCFCCISLLILLSSPRATAQTGSAASDNAPLITQAVDESNLVVLRGNTHPLALPQYDQGAVPPDLALHRMLLVLKRGPAQEAALDQLLDEQQDNSSPSYHQWLTPQQFGQQFGPADQDIQTISTWLQSHGFEVSNVSNGRVVIEFSGTAGQVADAFHTTIHNYSVNGEHHYANSSDPQIPAALAPAIAGVRSLHNFQPRALNHFAGKFSKDKQTGKVTPIGPLPIPQFVYGSGCGILGGTCEFIGPYDLATIYNVLPLWNAATPIDGTGQTIAIVAETDINPTDWSNFWNFFGVSPPKGTLNIIHNGPDPGILQDGEEGESDIDTQWSSAVAKGATIDFVVAEATETTAGVDLSAESIVDANLAPVMSESYGICEFFIGTAGNAFYNALWQQASAQGITVFISSGDQGSAVCDGGQAAAEFGLSVNGFGSTPYNVAVGGTDFNDLTNSGTYWNPSNGTNGVNAKGYIPETTWNDTCTNAEIFPYLGTTTAEQTCNNANAQNDGFLGIGGGSGGASNCTVSDGQTLSSCTGGYPKPPWQTGTGITDNHRDVPDVSLFASNGFNATGYVVCESDQGGLCNPNSGNFLGFGGTSVSSPAFAGIMALINQKTGERQGNANYVFYKMAAGSGNSCNSSTVSSSGSNNCIFYDIPTGSTIAMPCIKSTKNCTTSNSGDAFGVLSGFATTSGYDQATGLGSVNVANLVSNWSTYAGQFKATKFSAFSLSPATATHGQSVTVSATVVPQTGSGTPTGTVTLIANDNTANQQAAQQVFTLNSSGSVSGTTIMLPGGANESITAHYSGDTTFAPGDSSPFTITVNPEPSKSVVLVETYNANSGQITNGNATSYTYGTPTILRASVGNAGGGACSPSGVPSYACPTGSITLNDTFNPGTGPTTSPIAGSPYSLNSQGYTEDQSLFLLGGSHSIVASYSGDTSFDATGVSGSSATPDSITVTPTPTTITLSNIESVVPVGEGAALTATVISQITVPDFSPISNFPTQDVEFFSGTTQITGQIEYQPTDQPSAELIVTFSSTMLPVGNSTVTAKFPGDTNYSPSGSSNSVTIDMVIPTTTIITSSNPSVPSGTSLTFTAVVTPSQSYSQPMTGTVTFVGGPSELSLGVVNLTNGQAQFTTSSLPAGTFAVFAQYSGDTNYENSARSINQTVTPGPTFTISANPATMVVTSPGASGSATLTFTSQNGYTGTIPLSSTLFSGLPSETTCSFSVPSVTLTGSGMTGTSTATCQTTAPAAAFVPSGMRPSGKRPTTIGRWFTPAIGLAQAARQAPAGLALAGIFALATLFAIASLFAGLRAGQLRRRRWSVAFAAFAIASLVVMASCGGGSSGPPPPPPNPGTPVGLDQNVKVTFSGAGVSPSPTLSLPVNVE